MNHGCSDSTARSYRKYQYKYATQSLVDKQTLGLGLNGPIHKQLYKYGWTCLLQMKYLSPGFQC